MVDCLGCWQCPWKKGSVLNCLLSLCTKLCPKGPVAHCVFQIKRNKDMSISRFLRLDTTDILASPTLTQLWQPKMYADIVKSPLGFGKGRGDIKLPLLRNTGLYEHRYSFVWNYLENVKNFQTSFSENNWDENHNKTECFWKQSIKLQFVWIIWKMETNLEKWFSSLSNLCFIISN